MAITHTSTAATVIPELWSTQTADAREQNLIMPNLIDRRYESELKGKGYGDTVHIPGINDFSAADTLSLTASSRSTTYTAGQFASHVNLVIDTHAYKAFDIGTEVEIFSNIDTFSKFTHKAGYSVQQKVDDDLAGLIDNFGTNIVGTLAVALTDAHVRLAVQLLNDADVPEDQRVLMCSPKQQLEFAGIEKYTNSLFAAAVGTIGLKDGKFKGYFGTLYGLDWYMSTNTEGTNAAGHDNGVWHQESIAFAMLDNMREVKFYDIDSDSTKFAVHVLYGFIEVRDDHGVFARGA